MTATTLHPDTSTSGPADVPEGEVDAVALATGASRACDEDRDAYALRLLLTVLSDEATTSAAAAGLDALFSRGHDMVSDADIVEAVCAEILDVVRARLND